MTSDSAFGTPTPALALAPAWDANKYSRGKLVVVAGSERYPGAAVLAARASQRMGAGYTEVFTSEAAVDIVRLASPSLVVGRLSAWLATDAPESRPGHPCAVCVGPGFVPGDQRSEEATFHVLETARCPVIVDGGALAPVSTERGREYLVERAKAGLSTVITPHAGEAARIARALSLDEMAPDDLALALASALRTTVVLKGPDTYVSDGMRCEAMREGTAALAKAGTGDVLAGMIGALLAQGADPFEAALAGAVLHARAGKAAAERFGDISVTAEDVIDAIPQALRNPTAYQGGAHER